jgi:alkylhydroperoxidase family enzyme
VLHVVVLASFFGYLNRVADAVGIELDYEVQERPAAADPSTEPMPRPDADERPGATAPAIPLSLRPGAQEAFDAWRAYAMERDSPLSRKQREVIAGVVADGTGDDSLGAPCVTVTKVDRALAKYADTIARAPWRLGADAMAPLRAAGLDDLAIWDAIFVASYQSFASRLAVALASLAR